MKTKIVPLLLVLIMSTAVISGCFPQAPVVTQPPSPIDLTEAVLFAQATLTKAALEQEVIKYMTQQAMPTDTSTPEDTHTPTMTDTATPTDTPTLTNTPTLTDTPTVTNTATNTQVPPTATNTQVPPTKTKTPTLAPTSTPVRINFETGATNAFLESSVKAYQVKRYVFWAAKGQLTEVTLQTGEDAYIGIMSKAGTVLLAPSSGKVFYRDYLPANGDYYIDVYAKAVDANFGLNLMIPQRLSFDPGSYGMEFDDDVKKGSAHNYVVKAMKDQIITVEVEPGSEVYLTIWGKDGTVLLSGMGGLNEFSGKLPSTQDWLVNVHAIYGTGTQDYHFEIDIRY